MTVAELIEELQKFNPDMPVFVWDCYDDWWSDKVTVQETTHDGKPVILIE